MARQSKSKSSTGTAHCGLPTHSSVTSRGPLESGSANRAAAISGTAHIHFEFERQAIALEQPQRLDARAGAHPHHSGGETVADQERRRAARAVARDFRRAAVGVVQLDGAFGIAIGGRRHQHPAIRAHAGVTVANGAGDAPADRPPGASACQVSRKSLRAPCALVNGPSSAPVPPPPRCRRPALR